MSVRLAPYSVFRSRLGSGGNPKSEIRNPKQIRSLKSEIRNSNPWRDVAAEQGIGVPLSRLPPSTNRSAGLRPGANPTASHSTTRQMPALQLNKRVSAKSYASISVEPASLFLPANRRLFTAFGSKPALLLSLLLATTSALAQPRVFCANPQTLADAKAKFTSHDSAWHPAFRSLLAEADKALKLKPSSVMDKKRLPPSGDKHDFVSFAPYWWPNPSTSNGLPYIRKDGQRNPDASRDSDAGGFGRVTSSVQTLGLAYYFTGQEAYAAQAARLLRVWYLDPATRMNPHLNFGQAVAGENDGRGAGVIGSRHLVDLVDALGLLAGSPAWTAQDQAGMSAWLDAYLTWLTTSKIGLEEKRAANNHGSFYDTQVVALALFLGKTNLARQVLETAKQERFAKQIEPDGRQPRELARTTSFGYSCFNLRALIDLASLGASAGVDLWHFQTADGRSLHQALAFMAPYADPAKPWPYQQIKPANRASLATLFLRANPVYHDPQFTAALKRFSAKDLDASRDRMLFPMEEIPAR